MNKVLLIVGGALILGACSLSPGNQNTTSSTKTTAPTSQTNETAPSAMPNETTSPSAMTESPTTQSATTITYTDSGFSPASVTIHSGDSVTWVNNGSTTIQIGANPHPAHTGNREVSGGEYTLELAPGDSQTVTITQTGTTGYHNHLNPSQGGTIIVE